MTGTYRNTRPPVEGCPQPDPRELPADWKPDDAANAARVRQLEAAIRAVYHARGRYNSQIANCRMFELVGLFVKWPEGADTPEVKS